MSDEKAAKGAKLKITHAQSDAKYLKQGKLLLLRPDPGSEDELRRMNDGKVGHPYWSSDTMIEQIAIIRYLSKVSFRACAGYANAAMGEENAPHYMTLCRRVNKLDVSFSDGSIKVKNGSKTFRFSSDGTGVTPSTRSEWIRAAHGVRRGFIRAGFMINADTQKILAVTVTDEKTGDSQQFEELLDSALKNSGIDPEGRRKEVAESKTGDRPPPEPAIEVRADGGYDTGKIFQQCAKLGAEPIINIRINSNSRAKGVSRDRAIAVLELAGGGGPKHLSSLDRNERMVNKNAWKKKVDYGLRWLVEIVISAFKRRLGDYAMARRMENIVHEMMLKASIYNKLLRIGREAIEAT